MSVALNENPPGHEVAAARVAKAFRERHSYRHETASRLAYTAVSAMRGLSLEGEPRIIQIVTAVEPEDGGVFLYGLDSLGRVWWRKLCGYGAKAGWTLLEGASLPSPAFAAAGA